MDAWKPTREQLDAARGARVPDVIGPGLDVLFCGINPGLYSGAVGHHFARPGNRFWRTLHAAGYTGWLLSPFEERELLRAGVGITNLVNRSTATASELGDDELRRGARRLDGLVRRHRPRIVAVCGVGAYRTAFGRPRATVGRQDHRIGGAPVWVLPNPSGLNASYQLPDLVREFRRLRAAIRGGRRRLVND